MIGRRKPPVPDGPAWQLETVSVSSKRDDNVLLPRTAFRSRRCAAADLVYQLSPCFTLGAEGLYGHHQLQNRQDADAVRLQGSLKYDLVR